MINSTVFFLLLSNAYAAMLRKSHSLIQDSQINKLYRCKLSDHMFKFEANCYSAITRNRTNKCLQKKKTFP